MRREILGHPVTHIDTNCGDRLEAQVLAANGTDFPVDDCPEVEVQPTTRFVRTVGFVKKRFFEGIGLGNNSRGPVDPSTPTLGKDSVATGKEYSGSNTITPYNQTE